MIKMNFLKDYVGKYIVSGFEYILMGLIVLGITSLVIWKIFYV